MSRKLIITEYESLLLSALFEEDELCSLSLYPKPEDDILQGIYLGKVKNIVSNINAAFVEIADKKVCFLPIAPAMKPVYSSENREGKLRVGDEIIVQVEREDKSKKAPVLTANFSITGKFLVLVHGKTMIGVSQKIGQPEDRERLKGLIKPFLGEDFGFIVRTNAITASSEEIEAEIKMLIDNYNSIVKFGIHWTVFSCLYRPEPRYLRELRDLYPGELDEVITDCNYIFDDIQRQKSMLTEGTSVRLYADDKLSLSALYGLSSKLAKALSKNVWLKSGGYLVIEPTEALTSIDVNTGKAIAGKTATEETFFRINKEAAEEITRQLTIRNLSGIIIVDFIDMKEEHHNEELKSYLRQLLQKDHVPTQLIDITALGLAEITRKKVRKPLHEQIDFPKSSE